MSKMAQNVTRYQSVRPVDAETPLAVIKFAAGHLRVLCVVWP